MSGHTEATPLPLVVTRTVQRQFAIGRPDESLCPRDMVWEDYYVGFSGYFGSHDPHIFAAAPELFDALKAVRVCVEGYIDRCDYSKGNELLAILDAAISKATDTKGGTDVAQG